MMDDLPEKILKNSPKLIDFILLKHPFMSARTSGLGSIKSEIFLKDTICIKVPSFDDILSQKDEKHIDEQLHRFWDDISTGKRKGENFKLSEKNQPDINFDFEYSRPSFDNVCLLIEDEEEEIVLWIYLVEETELILDWNVVLLKKMDDGRFASGKTYFRFTQDKKTKYTIPVGLVGLVDLNLQDMVAPHTEISMSVDEHIDCGIIISKIAKTFSIINCNNVELELIEPSRSIQKKRRRTGRKELYSYHTIKIKTMGRKREKNAPKYEWLNRSHLVRGHFRTYTKENKLFGKYYGRFWVSPHVRGKNPIGVVVKDYELEGE